MSQPSPGGRIMSVTRVCAMLALLLYLAGCGGSSPHTSFVTPPTPRPPAPSAELFAQHIQALATPSPFSVAFKEVRVWSNVDAARWANISTGPGTYDFTVLDSFLTEFYLNGISDVLYTIGQVPGWASSNLEIRPATLQSRLTLRRGAATFRPTLAQMVQVRMPHTSTSW